MPIDLSPDTLLLKNQGEIGCMPLKIFTPYRIVDHVNEITPEFLKSKGITTVLMDLDNTLTRWNADDIDDEVFYWIKNLKSEGVRPCIVSNNKRSRIEKIAKMLEVPFIYRAAKPRKGSYRRALEAMNSPATKTAFVGDQLFTDVFGANRMQLYSILVKPIHPHEFIGTKIMRMFEKIVMPFIKPRE